MQRLSPDRDVDERASKRRRTIATGDKCEATALPPLHSALHNGIVLPPLRTILQEATDRCGLRQSNINIDGHARVQIGDTFIQNDNKGVEDALEQARGDRLAIAVRQWLRAPDATIDLNNARSKHHAGTGQWLVQGPAFTDWLRQSNSFLWLYGFAGCGKSVLCSTAVQHAFHHRQSSSTDSAVAFFFFSFTDESKQSASATLRAFLLQLSGQVPGLEEELTHLKGSYNQGTPPVPTLLESLRQVVGRSRHVYLLLDALDESPIGSSRDEVLSVIRTIRQWQLPNVHLLVTSRNEPDIRNYLQSSDLELGKKHIALNNDSVHQDIARYVAFQVDHDPHLQRWGSHRERIKSYLTQHAKGVFRWIECQFQSLRQCAHSERHLEKCLRTLPKSLDETYERMLCKIEFQEEARKILSLLCFSTRPLSVDEIIEALAVDIDELECYDLPSKFTDGANDLLRICPGLVEMDDRNGSLYGNDLSHQTHRDSGQNASATTINARVVRIAHFSVQEYLLSDRIQKSRASDFSLLRLVEHGRISKTCLLYLSHGDLIQQTLSANSIGRHDPSADLGGQHAFAKYAAEHWHYHYRQADSQLTRHLSEMAVNSLTTESWLVSWTKLHKPEKSWDGPFTYGSPTRDRPSLTYYASLLGLDSLLSQVLPTSSIDVNAREGFYGNALQAASARGHEKVVQILLENGAEVITRNKQYENALTTASKAGHEKIIQMLLNNGTDVNTQGGYYGNALQAASAHGHSSVVEILLDKGADVNAQGGEFGSAFYAASVSGHEKVVRKLLRSGAYIIPQNGNHALIEASYRGYEKVVQALLDNGVDVNSQQGCYGSALPTASRSGHVKVVRMLLDRGAVANARWSLNDLDKAIVQASDANSEEIVRMLLDKGGCPDARHHDGDSALYLASKSGHEKVVEILLDWGADINAGGFHGTPLRSASVFGHDRIVQILLDRGADKSAR